MTDLFLIVFPAGASEPFAKVYGVTKTDSVPTPSRISILDRVSQYLLFTGKTAADGSWQRYVPAPYVTLRKLAVIAFDDTGTFNAVIADNVSAEVVQ